MFGDSIYIMKIITKNKFDIERTGTGKSQKYFKFHLKESTFFGLVNSLFENEYVLMKRWIEFGTDIPL